jgi:hypothetical protein
MSGHPVTMASGWEYIKDQVSLPPMSAKLNELRIRIGHTVEPVSIHKLHNVWIEL